MALQYPLLFPYGEDGYREEILHNDQPERKRKKRKTVMMRESYAYRIQQKPNEGNTLLLAGRLYQHYLVDPYTAIKQNKLNWV